MENELPISEGRKAHMFGVAEYMFYNAYKYNLDRRKMYVLGLLHDIGYVDGYGEEHEIRGAVLVRDCFSHIGTVEPYYADLIAMHGKAPEHFSNEKKIPKELILLWEADMRVDCNGKNVNYHRRLQEIADKYGVDSQEYKLSASRVEFLLKRKI